MKWIEAIKRVLYEEGQKMHYTDISDKVIEKGYRTKVGASPAATVISTITTDITKNATLSPFLWVAPGEYYLRPEVIIAQQSFVPNTSIDEPEEESEIVAATQAIIEKGLIKSFGMYWSRNAVLWKHKPSIYGAQSMGSTIVDFAEQTGIYLLFDGREIIYVGQAIDQPISVRLFQHTSDRLGGRWDRFSWFGFLGVNEDASLTDKQTYYQTNPKELADTFEAILVEGLEPRQNRKRGNNFSGVEFNQSIDPEIGKRNMLEYFDKMKNQLIKG